MGSADQLTRTIVLFQTDLGLDDPGVVLGALTGTAVVLVADEMAVSTRAGQVALTTAAMLMARSGHSVFVDAPDALLIGDQPPLEGRTLHEAIWAVGDKLIDGVQVSVGCPLFAPDIAFVFGGGPAGLGVRAKRIVSVGWTDWAGELLDWPRRPACARGDWPMGAMAAAVLIASEAIKVAGRRLTKFSKHPDHYRDLFAPCGSARMVLAPEQTPKTAKLGPLDLVSAGAVSNAFLYALLRLPNVEGYVRTFDRDQSDASNRNRNMLLVSPFDELLKVELFEKFGAGLRVTGIPRHFCDLDLATLAERVAVGVDDIPTRWLLAGTATKWMGVGATSHFNSMASVHYPFSGCAACLHPYNEEQEGNTPTIAFVSFLAGLQMAADLIRDVGNDEAAPVSRSQYVNPLQPAGSWASPVPPTPNCPARCAASRLRA